MPQKKKDPSVRARRNKATTAATLRASHLRVVDDLDDLGMADLRRAIDELNLQRSAADRISKAGSRADLLERLATAHAPVPTLPDHPQMLTEAGPVDVEWHTQTRAWWHAVWTSPMATQWDDSDVHNVLVVALLYDDIWSASSAKARKDALAEYRLQRADLGLSPYARRRLEWTIEAAAEAQDRGRRRRAKAPADVAPDAQAQAAGDPRSVLASLT